MMTKQKRELVKIAAWYAHIYEPSCEDMVNRAAYKAFDVMYDHMPDTDSDHDMTMLDALLETARKEVKDLMGDEWEEF